MNKETKPLLSIKQLKISFSSASEPTTQTVVHGIDLEVWGAEIVGIVGESGSGKTVSMKALLRPPSESFKVSEGQLVFEDIDLAQLREKELRALRARRIGYIPQNASDALTPHERVLSQMLEMGKIHGQKLTKADCAAALETVGIHNPETILRLAAHQLSGGLAQRVVIAMTTLLRPVLIIADEPTSSVDASLKTSIMALLRSVRDSYGTAIVVITHDFDVVRTLCDRAYVLYKGNMMETAEVKTLLMVPKHPYTQMLMNCVSELESEVPFSTADIGEGTMSAQIDINAQSAPLLSISGLSKTYWLSRGAWRSPKALHAVKAFNLELPRGCCFGLIGESGSGKSTVAKLLMGLLEGDGGEVLLCGKTIIKSGKPLSEKSTMNYRRDMQVVFQLASNPLDPLRTVNALLADPIRQHQGLTGEALQVAVKKLLDLVKLPETYLNRFPGQLSGGERQRICIARALAVNPTILILDEPVSALDVSIQGQILELLMSLRASLGLTYLLITHDLKLARRYCTHLGVMRYGELVESGTVDAVIKNPQAEYTKDLLKTLGDGDRDVFRAEK
jgi:peptide/nickel transport system ATP-binding protein